MLYYHLIVEDNKGETRFLKNESNLDKIKEKARKYINNEDFRVDGYVFNKLTNVKRFKIITTEKLPEEIAKFKTQECIKDRIFLSYTDEDILKSDKFTKDITDDVLDNL